MAYHYVESGLDNIYLENGYTLHKTPYGEGLSILDSDGLHKFIGLWLISLPKPINGAELRFLRIQMEMTQKNFAALLGATEQTLRLWEKHRSKGIPGSSDRLLRALYKEYATGDGSVRKMVDRLSQLDLIDHPSKACLRETKNGWQLTAVD